MRVETIQKNPEYQFSFYKQGEIYDVHYDLGEYYIGTKDGGHALAICKKDCVPTNPPNVFITTTLPYINSNPHIGHALEFIQADVIARYLRTPYRDVRFNVGVDEHGLKVFEKAQLLGVDVKAYCDEQATNWKDFLGKLDIQCDNFYRTTAPSHKEKVHKFWNECLANDDLYTKKYTGLYCVGCESFKLDKDLVDGKCPDHDTVPQHTEEENWFFRLSKHREALLNWLDANKNFLSPEYKFLELRNVIEASDDISVSRLKKNVPWGIEVPNDPDQVIYVWFEALSNYIFAADYNSMNVDNNFWNGTTIQLCGPDNLRFQGCIFQAFLESAGIKHTTKLLVHGTVLDAQGRKMSKTLGNVVDPIVQIDKYGLDAVRYYAIAGLTTFGDGCWSEADLIELYNSELADNLGNLLARVLHLIDIKNVELIDADYEFKVTLAGKIAKVESAFSEFDLHGAVRAVTEIFKFGNQYINSAEPWKSEHYVSTLSNLRHLLVIGVAYLYPVIPNASIRALSALREGKKAIIFPKLEKQKQ